MGRVSKSHFQALLLIALLTSCGKPVEEAEAPLEDPTIPVIGVAGFGSQCPYGFTEDPFPVRLEAWGCPMGLSQIELAEPLTPLFIQVDCKKKIATVRKPNRRMDTAWEVLPDGTFFISLDGGFAHLKSDGPGRPGCSTPINVNLMGKVDCSDRDRAKISLESVFWLGKTEPAPSASASPSPSSSPSPIPGPAGGGSSAATPDSSSCRIPTGCYLYTKTEIKQCQ